MNTMTNLLCRKTVCFLIIAAAVLAVYIQVINAPFVLDDPKVVERNIKIRDLSNFVQLKEAFSARPLVNFTFALNYWTGGLNVRIYHVTNIVIHILNAILVYFLTGLIFSISHKNEAVGHNSISIKCLAPFFASALFALHPIQSQAVIYISQRAALMACFFYLLSVILYMLARRLKIEKQKKYTQWLFFILCTFFALMAFLSKKNAASLPLMILMLELVFFNDSRVEWKKKLPVVLGIIILMVLCFAWFAGAFKGDISSLLQRVDLLTREKTDVSRWQYLCTQFTVILLYLRLIIFPKGLNIDHGYPIKNGFFDDATPVSFLILLCVIILTLVYTKRYKMLCFGILWFLIALSVESSIIPIRDAMFEHRVYLAFPGMSIIFAYLMIRIMPEKEPTKIFIGGIILLISALFTFSRAQVWKNDLSLWENAVKNAPHNARAWNNYGNTLINRGQNQAAADAYRQAISAEPEYARPYCNLGKMYAEKGALSQAEKLFLKSVKLDPRFAEAHNNLAITYASRGNLEKGIQYFKNALKNDKNRPHTHYNLGKAYLDTNQPEKALEHLLRAINTLPDIRPRAYYLVGAAYAITNMPDKAAFWVHKARKKGLDQCIEDIKRDPRFDSCRKEVLAILAGF